ncbi:hypothetical protein SRO_4605 [Streptomyces rochei]|nr:hypothetical protein SRO_4605 [Streptomyces rochei]
MAQGTSPGATTGSLAMRRAPSDPKSSVALLSRALIWLTIYRVPLAVLVRVGNARNHPVRASTDVRELARGHAYEAMADAISARAGAP